MAVERVFLVGLSGSGKSTVAPLVADRLGWALVDSDREIEARTGAPAQEIFRDAGEARFRELEAEVLEEAAERRGVVVATGGGAPTNARSRAAIATGLVVWLDVTPERAAARLTADPATEARPLLAGDPLSRLEALFEERMPAYARSDHSIAVDYYDPAQVADRVVALVRAAPAHMPRGPVGLEPAAMVTTPGGAYPIYVVAGSLDKVGEAARSRGLEGRAFVLSDDVVASSHSQRVSEALADAGYTVSSHMIAAGEAAKTLAGVAAVYDWLLAARVERTDFMVCVGGGVVTDLGGFAAATVLRGIPFMHVPTTLLGMVDASIGGKTGVDHPLGKNLIGAFAQPRAVVIDPVTLATLPEREIRAGCAELVKHAFILDTRLLSEIEAAGGDLSRLAGERLIARSVAIKADVVSGDEREEGRRSLLNYGHTVGHGIEAAGGFSTYRHGEAVAVGMRAAGLLSVRLGMLREDEFERQQAVVRACGLPERAGGLGVPAVLEAMRGDKKARGGRLRWVLLQGLGNAVLRDDVPLEMVEEAVADVVG